MATAMLLLIALLSNSLLFAQAADESTGFSFAISGTTFTVMPGGATPVIASNGDGSVEIATVDEAVIWANLGGAGSGRLTDDQITGVTAGVSYAIAGNTLTFMDADGGEIYQFTVRDNSASGTPVADGSTKTYGNTAEHAKEKALREDSIRQGICRPIHQRCGRTDSSRQAGPPVSQNQIRQREQDIQFGNLFSQTSVPSFPVSKLALYYPKDMLHLGPYGGFLPFAAFDLRAGTIVCVFTLRGPSVDFVTDPFALAIEKNGVFPLFSAQVAAVAIYAVLIAG